MQCLRLGLLGNMEDGVDMHDRAVWSHVGDKVRCIDTKTMSREVIECGFHHVDREICFFLTLMIK